MAVFSGMTNSFSNAIAHASRASNRYGVSAPQAPASPIMPAASPPPTANQPTPSMSGSTSSSTGLQGMLGGLLGNLRSPEGFAQALGSLRPLTEPALRMGGLPALMAGWGRLSGNNVLSSLTERRASYMPILLYRRRIV